MVDTWRYPGQLGRAPRILHSDHGREGLPSGKDRAHSERQVTQQSRGVQLGGLGRSPEEFRISCHE
jgi:hypothetical protein